MKPEFISETTRFEGLDRSLDGNQTTSEIINLMGNDFSVRLQEHRKEGKELSRNSHMKSFKLKGKKIIAVIGENKANSNSADMADDIKAWYGAVLKGYKMIHDHIYNTYLPGKPPYEMRYPKALKYKHTDDADYLIVEWVENLVSLDKIDGTAQFPNSHIDPINAFLDDRNIAIQDLSVNSGITENSESKSRFWQFIIKMPYGDVIVEDDFGLRLNGNGAEEEHLYNAGYILGTEANEKPIIYLTDGLIAAGIKSKT